MTAKEDSVGTDSIAGPIALEHFSTEAQQIIAKARSSASEEAKKVIDINDLLAAAKQITENAGGGSADAITRQPLTENARRVVDVARSRATQHGHEFIGTEDLLRALFEAPESLAIKHLTEKGVDKDVVWGVRTFTDNAQTVVDKARLRAKENAHQFIGTEDLLWAMFNAPTVEGRAVVHMQQRGITKEGMWGVHQYTPNVHKVLDLALERAEGANQTTIGTEDLLWAIFHNPSMNSRAIEFLESKGITKGSVWGVHRFSDNVNKVLQDARKAAETNKLLVIGTEDLLRALLKNPTIMDRVMSKIDTKGLRRTVGSENYTANLLRVLEYATQEAQRRNHTEIGTEDILRAFFSVPGGEKTQASSFMMRGGFAREVFSGMFEYSENMQRVLEAAQREAILQGHQVIGTEDMLYALWQGDGTGKATRASYFLQTRGITRQALASIFKSEKKGAQHEDEESSSESTSRMFVIGGLAGAIECVLQQPLIGWKNALQTGLKDFSPMTLYRGVGVNATSITPITALQYGADTALMDMVIKYNKALGIKKQDIPDWQQLTVAATAGVISGFAVAPAELVMINQLKRGTSFVQTTKNIYNHGGCKMLFRGFTPTAIREAGWTMSFLGLAPALKQVLQNDSKFFSNNDVSANAFASVMAGQVGAFLTQPVDTIKSRMQVDLGLTKPMQFSSTYSTIKSLYKEGGTSIFFSGLVPRTFRVIGAVFILGETSSRLATVFDDHDLMM